MSIANQQIIESFFEEASITGELSNSSIYKYQDSIKKFLSILGNKNLFDIDNRDFNTFILEMKKNGASGSRISNVISAMKKLMSFLQKEGKKKLKLDLEKIRKPKIEKKEVGYLTEHEIKILLETIKQDIEKSETIRKVRMMCLVILLLQTGARIGEALSIKIKDIDRINMEIPIIGKGKKPRSLYISGDTLYWIDRYLKVRKSNNEFLFTILDGKNKWQQTDVGRSFRYYRKRSGIKGINGLQLLELRLFFYSCLLPERMVNLKRKLKKTPYPIHS